MEKILLHICCGVCASPVVGKLREENFDVVGFFYNPNIHPEEEYLKRLDVAREVARILGFELIPGAYDKDLWFANTKGLENEPEGGLRCSVCFKMRLKETQKKARELNINKFTTTLTVSPHKNTKTINEMGGLISPSEFLVRDFKKQNGFKLAMEFAKRYNLYRQHYCGCIYSRKR
jgi:predicted adenine nucleotide alpha hydrolase (AANH) superfamily ATPase